MELTYFQEFKVLATVLNYGRASEVLHMSRPALSKHVSKLEEYCGFKLFSEQPPMQLTPAGRMLFDAVCEFAPIYEKRLDHCRDIGEKFPNSFYIGMPAMPDKASAVLQNAIMSLPEDYQRVYSHTSIPVEKAIELISQHTVDACIYYSTYDTDAMNEAIKGKFVSVIEIATEPLFLMTDASNPLSQASKITMDDVKDIQFLYAITKHGTLRKTLMDSFFEQVGCTPSYKTIYIENFDQLSPMDLRDSAQLVGSSTYEYMSYKNVNNLSFTFIPVDLPIKQIAYFMYRSSDDNMFLRALKDVLQSL
jgi:DNA-binding transcriptional LysR family regulator